MSDQPSLIAAARAVGDVLEERFLELETNVRALTTRLADLELEHKATLRRVEMLERRLTRQESATGESRAAEDRD